MQSDKKVLESHDTTSPHISTTGNLTIQNAVKNDNNSTDNSGTNDTERNNKTDTVMQCDGKALDQQQHNKMDTAIESTKDPCQEKQQEGYYAQTQGNSYDTVDNARTNTAMEDIKNRQNIETVGEKRQENTQGVTFTNERHDDNEINKYMLTEEKSKTIDPSIANFNAVTMVTETKDDPCDKTSQSENLTEHSDSQTSKRVLAVRKVDPVTSHIRMEEIQWQRLLERRLTRETEGRAIEQRYKNEIKTQYRNIEKQNKTHNLILKRRMEEFEKKRRANNMFFCRMVQKKDREYQSENHSLQQRLIEIEKQKQRNVDKLRARVNYFEEKKQKEQELFLQRMQELEKQREEEYDASQKRLHDIEKRKYNERKAWLLHVQKVEGLKKEVFKKSVGSLNDAVPITNSEAASNQFSPRRTSKFLQQNVKDQARIMENITSFTSSIPHLPKIHKRQIGKQKKNNHTDILMENTENEATINASSQKKMDVECKSENTRLDVEVSN